MSRRPTVGVVPCIEFDPTSDVPFYVQIYNGYRGAIASGQLMPGQRLPSTRTIAEHLEVSRFPVLSAFDQLLRDGYIVGRVGSGTYVREDIPEHGTKPITLRRAPATATGSERLGPADGSGAGIKGVGPLSIDLPAVDHFPRKTFSRLLQRHVDDMSAADMAYGDPAGHAALREAVAAYLRTSRAVVCDASQVLIVAGSQSGLAITALALASAESLVCVEEPGSPEVRQALGRSKSEVIGVPVDEGGMDVRALKRLPTTATLVHVTPSHQYPLGPAMEVTRRLELLDWAKRNGSWIVEDDFDSEFHYNRRPLGAIQGMDTAGRVIYLGTFSRVLFPALRFGYMVVPRELVQRFVEVRMSLDICSPILDQLVLADFIGDGHLGRHLLQMRRVYRGRRDALVAALRENAADVLTPGHSEGGLHLVAFLPDGIDDSDVVKRVAIHGLYPSALSPCYAGSPPRLGLMLGFGGSDECVLTRAVTVLAELIRTMD